MQNAIIVTISLVSIYFTYLFFTNKEKFKAQTQFLVHKAEWLFSSGLVKKEWVLSQLDIYVKDSKVKWLLKLLFNLYANKFIEAEVEKANTETKPIVKAVTEAVVDKTIEKVSEKLIGVEEKSTIVQLADKLVMTKEDKGLIYAEAKAQGNTARDGIDWQAGIGVVKKF